MLVGKHITKIWPAGRVIYLEDPEPHKTFEKMIKEPPVKNSPNRCYRCQARMRHAYSSLCAKCKEKLSTP